MVMIYNSSEMAKHFYDKDPRLAELDGPLWVPEEDGKYPCYWFVCVDPSKKWSPFTTRGATSKQYWDWCDSTLKSHVRCFSIDLEGGEEWWGFGDKGDISIWILKWT